MSRVLDLFGDPVPENWGKRGRPQHVPTQENINKVMMLVALGWNNERISNSLDITLPTFRKHYFSLVNRQRSIARDRMDSAYAMRVWKEVEGGNVGAMRLWAQFLERNDRMETERSMGTPDRPAEAPTQIERVGKKAGDAQRALDADAALTAELDDEARTNTTH
jgi:hypothetical protein